MRRELTHYWRTHLAVTVGAAVATAVLAGALIVGDSVRGSLRQLTLERLGGIEHALAGQRFFPSSAAERFAEAAPVETAPAILLQASAQHADTKTRASQVGLSGVDGRFLELFGATSAIEGGSPLADGDIFAGERGLFPPVVINRGLADALGAQPGDAVLFSLKRWTEVPSGSLLSADDTASVVETVRLEVLRVLDDAGLGSFGLAVHQSTPYNAFVPLEDLQRALDQDDAVNAVLAGGDDGENLEAAQGRAAELDALLLETLTLEELGLLVTEGPGEPETGGPEGSTGAADDDARYLQVESGEYVLRPALVTALRAESQETPRFEVLTYLANSLRSEGTDENGEPRAVPYSTVTALDPRQDDLFGDMMLTDGSPAPTLENGDILVNTWTADDLGVGVGDAVDIVYFAIGPREELIERTESFTVKGVVELTGLGADSTLSQEYPGIAGSADMSDWDPPFPISLSRVRPKDEIYWDDYRDTPKAFVNLDDGRRLWETRWGNTTAIRVAPAAGTPLDAFRTDFEAALKTRLSTAAFGLTFQPVLALGLGASGGATDFGGLFIGLSQFVIVSAALLVALLFGLAVEQRVSEIGLRLAVGFRPKNVRGMLLREGLVLAVIGGLVGLLGAVGYASAMMYGLKTWWLPAVGTSRLELFLTPVSLVGGFISAIVVVLLTIFLTVRKVGRVPAPQLLKKATSESGSARAGRASKITAAVALTVAFGAVGYAVATGQVNQPSIFFLAGPLLLVGLLALFAQLIDRPSRSLARGGAGALVGMAVANTRRNRSRSLYSTTLVAFATFMIVTVAAFQEDFSDEDLGRDSGAGGYQLLAQSDVPVPQDLGSKDGRFELGLPGEVDDALADATVMPFRLVPGDDTSCLNLYQPRQPRLLGVPRAQRDRGGFTFQQVSEDVEDPWTLLDRDLGAAVVPVIGDFNSTQWILKLPLDGTIPMENERGEPIELKLVASFATSVFQSELLVSEEQLLRHFPSRAGFPYFLIETDDPDAVSVLLERELAAYGFDAITTVEKLAAFHAVQNTYLATFRVLGGLGLLLGTIGLAVVLVRNVLERRGELAALRAFGFRGGTLTRLVLGENVTLLLAGLGIGTAAALVTAGPHLLQQAGAVPWSAIAGTLGLVFAVGFAVCWIAARGARGADVIPTVKAER
ncbi:MAG: FtsX-like permease family protein [Acidobacteriota bacterium]